MEETNSIVPEWKLARDGIELLINNKINEAETHFKQYPDSLQILAAYCCTQFMVKKFFFPVLYYNTKKIL